MKTQLLFCCVLDCLPELSVKLDFLRLDLLKHPFVDD
jgi:hypothetical protein